MVRKQIDEDKSQSHGRPGSSILSISDSPFSEEIMSHWFSKKSVVPSFDCNTRVIDPIQHLRADQVKTVVHSHDDPLSCCVFPSSLKGVALNWSYSHHSRSLKSFEEVNNVFFNQYA